MKNFRKYTIVPLLGLLIVLAGCQTDEYDLGELITPSNVNLIYEIEGVDDENPYGDGSGLVHFTVTANNAITYNFDFGDGTDIKTVPGGSITKQFTINGVNTYNVVVYAVGTGGIQSTKTDQVEVLSDFEDEEAVQFLTGGSSKTWYWASDQPAHTGLGPTAEDYGNTEYAWPAWWSISPWDPDKACMYEAEFVFTKTDDGVTFEQTIGPAFIPGAYADVIGVQGDICHGEDVAYPLYGVKNVIFSPSSSLASLNGGYKGTTMTFTDEGFMCWWVGTSEYDIIEVTDNILRVRIKQDETYAWYHIFTNVKPEQ